MVTTYITKENPVTPSLSQLQSLWNRPNVPPIRVEREARTIVPNVERVEPLPFTDPPARWRCTAHTDPTNWSDEPVAHRPGWLRSTCAKCQAFIGYRPAETKPRF